MMRVIFLLLVSSIALQSKSQTWNNYLQKRFKSYGLWADSISIQPSDTTVNKLAKSIAIKGTTLYIADGAKWAATGGGGGNLRFTNNVVVNGATGTTLGVWQNGETIPLAGKLFDSLAYILATKCNPPNYVAPTAGITASPTNGSYETGTNLGLITLSSSFVQNNGGANTTTTYYLNGVALGSNTSTTSSLTTTQVFYVNRGYLQGSIINNNCGTPDATGRINAGNVNSGTISFTAFDKRYYGFVNSTTPTNAQILALTQDNSGATGSLTLSNVTPTGSQFLAYFTKGSVSSVIVNGIPATGAFTFTNYSITNAQGFASTYTYVYSNNPQTSTLSSVIYN